MFVRGEDRPFLRILHFLIDIRRPPTEAALVPETGRFLRDSPIASLLADRVQVPR